MQAEVEAKIEAIVEAKMTAKMADMQKQIDGSKDPLQRNDDQINFVSDTKGAHPEYLDLTGRVEKLEDHAAEDEKAIKEFRSLNIERTLNALRFHFTAGIGAIARLAKGQMDVKIDSFPKQLPMEQLTRKRKRGFGEEG